MQNGLKKMDWKQNPRQGSDRAPYFQEISANSRGSCCPPISWTATDTFAFLKDFVLVRHHRWAGLTFTTWPSPLNFPNRRFPIPSPTQFFLASAFSHAGGSKNAKKPGSRGRLSRPPLPTLVPSPPLKFLSFSKSREVPVHRRATQVGAPTPKQ